MRHIMQTIGRGQAGVYRVVSELILRGHAPYFPSIDSGVDLIVDGSVRVQVKTTLRTSGHWRYHGKFLFQLSKSQSIRRGKYVPGQVRVFSDVCDFVVLWAVEPNRFWIVPAAQLDRRHTIIVSDTTQWREVDVDLVKRLKAEGKTWDAIEEITGIPRRTLTRRMGVYANRPNRRLADVNKYENRWDLISGGVSMMREANAAVAAGAGALDVARVE